MTAPSLLVRHLLILAGLLASPGCSDPVARGGQPPVIVRDIRGGQGDLHGTDVSDVIPRPPLVLRDTAGAVFDLRARPVSELTVLFFGYTRCRDVCPTTMADLAAARRMLTGAQREQVAVAFVTEDPRFDTPTTLRPWLDRFDTSFTGLIGGNAATVRALSALKAPASSSPSRSRPAAPVDHTGTVFVFAADRTIVYTGGTSPSEFASDLSVLLRQRARR